MESSFALLISAFAIGVLVADWKNRAAALNSLNGSRNELLDTLAKLNVSHNSIATRFEALQDHVTALDFKVKGK